MDVGWAETMGNQTNQDSGIWRRERATDRRAFTESRKAAHAQKEAQGEGGDSSKVTQVICDGKVPKSPVLIKTETSLRDVLASL